MQKEYHSISLRCIHTYIWDYWMLIVSFFSWKFHLIIACIHRYYAYQFMDFFISKISLHIQCVFNLCSTLKSLKLRVNMMNAMRKRWISANEFVIVELAFWLSDCLTLNFYFSLESHTIQFLNLKWNEWRKLINSEL